MRSGGGSKQRNLGFTIVELLIVIVVIGVLAAIILVTYSGLSQKATIATISSDLENASKQLKLDQVLNNAYPASLAAANSGKGVQSSPGTTYPQYSVNNSTNPQSFCINALNNSINYRITNNNAPTVGDCSDFASSLRFDAGNTASYPGSGTTFTDLSSNGNTGTLLNGALYDSSGGGSIKLDGTNDYVDAGAGSNLNAITGSVSYTLEAWIKPLVVGTAGIVDMGTSGANGFGLHLTGTNLNFGSHGAGNFNSVATLTAGNWYYVAGVYNNAASPTSAIYINGAQDTTGTVGATGAHTTSLTIGYFTAYFNGYISQVTVNNRALSSAEILANFNNNRSRYGL